MGKDSSNCTLSEDFVHSLKVISPKGLLSLLEVFVSSLEGVSALDIIERGAIGHHKDMQSIFEDINKEDLNYKMAGKIEELKRNSDYFLDFIRLVIFIKGYEFPEPKAKEQSS